MAACAVRRILWLLALPMLLLPALPVGAADVLQPRIVAKKTFSESYTAIADLEGDAYLQLQLRVSNIGVRNRRGMCRLLLVERGKPTWSETITVSRSEWSYQPGTHPTLQVGSCSLGGGRRTEFRAELARATVTLALDAPIRSVRPLDRRTQIDGDFYESDVLIPWAAASVTIEGPRGKTRILRGHGYGDHSRSTALPAKLAQRWIRFRGLAASGSVLLLARFPGDGGAADGWLWRQGQAAPTALREVSLIRLASSGGQWKVRAESLSGSTYEIVTQREIHRHAPVEERGWLVQVLRRLLGNPVTYTYRAMLTPTGEEAEAGGLRGIAEVTIVDE